MSSTPLNESWFALDKVFEHPAGIECYTVQTSDAWLPDDTDLLVSTMESVFLEDLSLDEKGPVYSKDEDWRFSAPSSQLDYIPPDNAPLPYPATSQLRSGPETRPNTSYQGRAREAAASHPYKARRYRRWRAPGSMQGRCDCCCNCCQRRYRPRRYRPRRYRPRVPSWEHLPVAIQPTKWYQVVGSMQCNYCKAQGRHQMTSWMCQRCKAPLCLMPHRNCYNEWHGQSCELRVENLPLKEENE
ncbi:uncharacterized protein LOC121954218 [Plectropomus leopardus]|uniref:uncharacterized protein LOC121954218 n=1 Tax=Plectropomus leopardus TaxID=160734 RepID=UPI001C4C6623|nr:uncharacterized protein LOC121954218 [Plectropomus leopardus]